MGNGISVYKTIELADKKFLENFTADFSPYCDFSFTNLFIWNTGSKSTFYKLIKDSLVIKTYSLMSQRSMYSLLGHNIDEEVLDELLKETDVIEFVPEECINTKLAQNPKYHITEDVDNHDYIIDLSQLKNLEGREMKPVRQKLTRFKRDFQSYESVSLDPVEDYNNLMKLYEQWRITKSQDHKKALETTESALIKLLKNSLSFNIQLLGVKSADNGLLGFVINELTNTDTAIGLFGFADNKIKGIYQVLEYATSTSLVEQGYKYINLEQDLGIQNLRKAKQELRPVKLLKKYRIEKSNH